MDRIQRRFDKLAKQAEEIADGRSDTPSKKHITDSGIPFGRKKGHAEVDYGKFTQWSISATELIQRVFGEESPTTTFFLEAVGSRAAKTANDNAHVFRHMHAIFRSAKEQYEGGYLFDVRNLVHAEVFSDELEQAEHFLAEDYKVAAAVMAGVVLETTLRRMCRENGIDVTKDNGKDKTTDAMISELAQVSVFNKMRADQLRAWAKIRNSAAHGKPKEFDEGEVKRMIEGVRDFVATQMS